MSKTSSSVTAQQVAWYYDQNTTRFLSLGGSGNAAAIHRQVWAPGVRNPHEAFTYINRWIANAIQPALAKSGVRHVVDLGCGVGGSATWLADHPGTRVTGITNSPVQQHIAEQRARDIGLEGQCRFLLADFTDLPPLGPLNAAFAIESFVHAPAPSRFFTTVARSLPPGGRLVICDDFINPTSVQGDPRAAKWLAHFRRGWHINNLLSVGEVKDLAMQAGLQLIHLDDLTPHLRLFGRLRLFMMNILSQLPLRTAYRHNLAGGAALQVCLRNRWTVYHALAFEKAVT